MESRISKRFITMIVAALAIVVLVAGCGGGSDSGDSSAADTSSPEKSTGPALTKAEFIKQGDEICTTTEAEVAAEVLIYSEDNGFDEAEGPTEEQEEGLVTEVVLPGFQALAGELAELGPPEGEEAQVEEIIDGIEEVVADGEADPGSVIGTDDPFADINEKATEFGFKVCGDA